MSKNKYEVNVKWYEKILVVFLMLFAAVNYMDSDNVAPTLAWLVYITILPNQLYLMKIIILGELLVHLKKVLNLMMVRLYLLIQLLIQITYNLYFHLDNYYHTLYQFHHK